MITTLDNLKKEVCSIYNTNPVTEETFLKERDFFLDTCPKYAVELINKFLNIPASMLFLIRDGEGERLSEFSITINGITKQKYIYSNSYKGSYYLELGDITFKHNDSNDFRMYGNISNVRYEPMKSFCKIRGEEDPNLSELLLWIDLVNGDMEQVSTNEYIFIHNLITNSKPEFKDLISIKDHNLL